MQKLDNNKFKDFSRICSILAKFKDSQGLENETIFFSRNFKDFQGCGNPNNYMSQK